jgi:mRNA interferase YafQ
LTRPDLPPLKPGRTNAFKKDRECHLGPDWLLIYRIEGDEITFERMGTHADLFDE